MNSLPAACLTCKDHPQRPGIEHQHAWGWDTRSRAFMFLPAWVDGPALQDPCVTRSQGSTSSGVMYVLMAKWVTISSASLGKPSWIHSSIAEQDTERKGEHPPTPTNTMGSTAGRKTFPIQLFSLWRSWDSHSGHLKAINQSIHSRTKIGQDQAFQTGGQTHIMVSWSGSSACLKPSHQSECTAAFSFRILLQPFKREGE